MDFITGDGVCRAIPTMKPGIIVTINVQDKRFNGKYHVTAVRHRYVHAGPSGGFRTEFKFRRDAKSRLDATWRHTEIPAAKVERVGPVFGD